jgi:hypothetical protein
MKKKKLPFDKHTYTQNKINESIPEIALQTKEVFMKDILPTLRDLYTVNVLHRTTMQTRIVNELNDRKIDYYPYYRKVNDFKNKTWRILANDGEVLTVIKTLLD